MSSSKRPVQASPAASISDIEACEAAVGMRFPPWLRQRLLAENGWECDDRAGQTRDEWRFLPVLDRSDKKRRARTAEDIAWHTQQLHKEADVPDGAVVVARARSATTRLILLPDAQKVGELSSMLWQQNGVAQPLEPAIEPDALGRKPEQGEGSGLRPRSELPEFLYHPDPVATGSIRSNHVLACPCCGLKTGWIYECEPYGRGSQPANLCPWCIADGRAATKYGAQFVSDIMGDVPDEVVDAVMHRTPGFVSWQGEQWLTHCGDAAQFLGGVGWDQLKDMPDAIASLLDEGIDEDALPLITSEGDFSGYLFQCRHCKIHLAYADAS